MKEYDKQAMDFLKDTKTEFKAVFLKNDFHFLDDKDKRDIYEITLSRRGREFKFNFGQSIAESGFMLINSNTGKEAIYTWFKEITYNKDRNRKKLLKDILKIIGSLGCYRLEIGKEPEAYDVLSGLTCSDVGSFEDFCGDYGYDTDSRKAEQIYNAVLNEWNNLKMLYTEDELNKLQEIQ